MITPEPGGWWHEYVCPVHHTELLPPPTSGIERRYPCEHGCELAGEPWESAWLALEHQRNARDLAGLPPKEALEMLAGYRDLYTRLSETHDAAKPWMLAGRLFEQALSEAIWAVHAAVAVAGLIDRVDEHDAGRLVEVAAPLLRGIHETMVAARSILVGERNDVRSNFTAWLNAAGAATSRALADLGEPVADHGWITGPHGLYAHVRAAILDDGWEWEGSTYYHNFVLLAYLETLRGTDPAALPADVAARLAAMVGVRESIALGDGLLPALHDSPYHRPAGASQVRTEHRRVEALEYAESLALAHAFLDLPAADSGSRVFADVGYAVLRPPGREWMALVDFGPHGGSHGHLDKLALYLYGPGVSWQPDYGVGPYASPRRAMYRSTSAHPTFSVDGADQRETTGHLLGWSADDARVVARFGCDDAYPGVTAVRHVELDAQGVFDVVQLRAAAERDFAVHFRPDVAVAVRATPGGWRTDWGGAMPLACAHASSVPARLEPVPGWGPADDPQRHRRWLDWSTHAQEALFVTQWCPGVGRDGAVDVDLERAIEVMAT